MYGTNSLTDPSLAQPYEGKGLDPSLRKVNINPFDGNFQCVRATITESVISNFHCDGKLTLPVNSGSLDYTTPGTICYNTVNRQLQISNGGSWNNVLASPGNTTLTFRPGYTGPSTNGIYGSWPDLYSDLTKINGTKNISFDNLLIPNNVPIVIPPGTWDMTDTTWCTCICSLLPPPDLFIQIHISDGATINGLCGIDGILVVTYFGTTQPAIIINQQPTDKQAVLYLANGASLNIAGTQPFIDIINGFFEIIMLFGTHIQNGPGVVNCSGTALTIIGLGTYSTLEDNVLSGNGNYTVIRFSPGSIVNIPLVQPGITGSLGILNFYKNPDTYSNPAPPGITDDSNIGYKIGDNWINTTTNDIYFAVNVTPGAAIWKGPY